MLKSGIYKVLTFFFVLLLACSLFKLSARADEIAKGTGVETAEDSKKTASEEPTDDIIYHTLSIYDKDGTTILGTPYQIVASSNLLTLKDFYAASNAKKYGTSQSDFVRILNGYNVAKWKVYTRKNSEEEYTYQRVMDWNTIKSCQKTNYDLSRYDIKFVAVYANYPVSFPIKYVLNKGKYSESYGSYMNVNTTVKLGKPTKKGYIFDGWYLSSDFSEDSKVTRLSKVICKTLDYDSKLKTPTVTVYAKWKDAAPSTIGISKLANSDVGKVTVTIKAPSSTPKGYEIQFSTDSTFKTNVRTVEFTSGTKFTVDSLTKGKKYYFRLRAYNIDSTKERTYSSYCKTKSVTIKKGEDEVTPSSSAATLKSVKVTGKSVKTVNVSASVSKRVASKDDYYYLVKVDPITNAFMSVLTSVPKSSSLTIKLPLTDSTGRNLYATKFALAVKSSDKDFTIISSAGYIDNPTQAASYTGAFPTPKSKKGRQGVYTYEDGDKHYFTNFMINSIFSSKAEGGEPYKYNGKTYYFKFDNRALDEIVSNVNADGGTVTFQIMLRYDSSNINLIKPSARSETNKNYYAFNIEEASARNQIEAAFYALAEHYSQSDRHVDNWILGNEVNTFRNTIGWYWAGYISNDQFITNYAQTFRTLYYAVACNSKNSRVYTSVDHTFNNRDSDWGVRYFTISLNNALKSMNSCIKWNLAYHAYSAVLTNADFWNDNTSPLYSTSFEYSTDFVSPYNIEVLVQHVKDNFNDVHIILSEQAFSSTGGNNPALNGGRDSGEAVQAAAVAYLFYKVMFNPNIDCVIYSHPHDDLGAGMDFALKGQAYNVYKYMDTPSYSAYTSKYVETITGSSSATWNSLISTFSDYTLTHMPSRK